MNRSPLNGVALAGSITYRPLLDASLVLGAEGTLTYGMGLRGEAQIRMTGLAEVDRIALAEGDAELSVEAVLDEHVTPAVMIEAAPEIEVEGEMAPYAIFHPELPAEIALGLESDERTIRALLGEGVASIVFDGLMDPDIRSSPRGEGVLRIRTMASLAPHVGRARRLEGVALIKTSLKGMPSLVVRSASGEARIRLRGQINDRLGHRAMLSGLASMELRGRLESLLWHQRQAEGEAVIGIELVAERHGRPAIPDQYVEAHPSLVLTVPPGRRGVRVPPSRRVV